MIALCDLCRRQMANYLLFYLEKGGGLCDEELGAARD